MRAGMLRCKCVTQGVGVKEVGYTDDIFET